MNTTKNNPGTSNNNSHICPNCGFEEIKPSYSFCPMCCNKLTNNQIDEYLEDLNDYPDDWNPNIDNI